MHIYTRSTSDYSLMHKRRKTGRQKKGKHMYERAHLKPHIDAHRHIFRMLPS